MSQILKNYPSWPDPNTAKKGLLGNPRVKTGILGAPSASKFDIFSRDANVIKFSLVKDLELEK